MCINIIDDGLSKFEQYTCVVQVISETPTTQHIIYNKIGLFENARRPTTDPADHALTFLFPPRAPKKNIHVLPKNVSPSDFPSPVC